MDATVIGLILLVGLSSYFLPTIVATLRHAKRPALVFAVNLLSGWTIIGWIATLIWVMSGLARQPNQARSRPLDSDGWFIDPVKASQSSDAIDQWVLGRENLLESPRNR